MHFCNGKQYTNNYSGKQYLIALTKESLTSLRKKKGIEFKETNKSFLKGKQ
jgi:hypothetical protein